MLTAIKPIVPIFSKPDISSVLVDEILYGSTADILEETNGFYEIKTYYGYTGFAKIEDFIFVSDWNPEYLSTSATLDIMPTPEYRHNPIITLPRGSFIQIDKSMGEKNFVGVILADHRKGFCVKYHVRKRCQPNEWKTQEITMRESIVKTAMQYLNVPYRWGGKSPYGIDCSGLCSEVYRQHEILIWRDANLQGIMKPICREQLKPGDLIFFPGHVAMYIGNDRFIHSNQKYSGVCINSFDAHHPDYNETLLNNIIGMGSVWSNT